MTNGWVDPVQLEIFRSRLEAAAEEGALAIEQTAVSPVVANGKDFATNILDQAGRLLVGGGRVDYKWAVASNPVLAVLQRHGPSFRPGDVFASNDPHDGGGNHPQDIEVCCPIFADDRLIAWVGASAHFIDVGGMSFGSWSPDATECYQEAVRFPPVRLFDAGIEQHDVWALLLNNVRLPELFEMDLRGLIAGLHVTSQKIIDVARSIGRDAFGDCCTAMCANTEKVLRRRIAAIAPGTYSMSGWVEWGDHRTDEIPCTLTVRGGSLTFDYTGAPGQIPYFINSKAYIVRGQVATDVRNQLAQDLPYCEGIFAPVDVICPRGSLLDSRPPAPVGSAHLDAAMTASGVALQCLQMALAASEGPELHRLFHGPMGTGALATHSWSYLDEAGLGDGVVVNESWQGGSSAGADRDGSDLVPQLVGTQNIFEFVDIEVVEAWYPISVVEKRCTSGTAGAGKYRAGAGCLLRYRFTHGERITGTMLAMREALPIAGVAGGLPGAMPGFQVLRADGGQHPLEPHETGVALAVGDTFEVRVGAGGGWGDPLDRNPALVAADVAGDRLSREQAREVYGIALNDDLNVDAQLTSRIRQEYLLGRLRRARPPVTVINRPPVRLTGEGTAPLYHGVVQLGGCAIAADSGAVLAVAPAHWTDGCPRLEIPHGVGQAREWLQRSYLDPLTGRLLYTEAVPVGSERSFATLPDRWTGAAPAASAQAS